MSEKDEKATNPWVVKAPKQREQVPIGFYMGVFKGVEDFAMPQTGEPKWRFAWEVSTGEHKGKLATALTDKDIRENRLPGQLIAGLLGRAIVEKEDVQASVEAQIGTTFMVSVAAGPKGGKPGVKACSLPPQS